AGLARRGPAPGPPAGRARAAPARHRLTGAAMEARTTAMTGGAPMLELDLRRVYGAFPPGLSVVAGLVSGEPAGIAASSFVAVSLEPPRLSVSVGHASTTLPPLRP